METEEEWEVWFQGRLIDQTFPTNPAARAHLFALEGGREKPVYRNGVRLARQKPQGEEEAGG